MSLAHRPIIGIPTQNLHAIDGIPPALPNSWVMNQRYIHAVTAVGGVPWLIPLLDSDAETLQAIYQRLDGILLPGGIDVDPATYGAGRHALLGRVDPPRDAVELQLTRWAMADEKPLLGLCRGIQIFNVARGGTLFQDVGTERAGSIKHDYYPSAGYSRDHLAHEVELAAGSRLEASLGRSAMVNSMHHQGLDALGDGLVVTAVAPDGLIEGIESLESEHFLVGVQWHPEALEVGDARWKGLFRAFVEAAAAFAGQSEVARGAGD